MSTIKTNNKLKTFSIVIGLVIGALLAIVLKNTALTETVHWIVKNVTAPLGSVFLRSLFMVVTPLVLCSLATGVGQLGSVERLGHIGKRLALFYVSTTFLAVLIGQGLVHIMKPGEGVDKQFVQTAQIAFQEQTSSLVQKSEKVNESLWPGIIDTIVPKNILEELSKTNMLATIFVALLIGIALLKINSDESRQTIHILKTISDAMIMIIGWVMLIAPFAVAALMFNAVVQFDTSILNNVIHYFTVVVIGYITHFVVVYFSVMKWLVRLPILYVIKNLIPVYTTAFSTSSSNATLPTTIKTLKENFGVPKRITTFCAPLGATINMDGTALFEIVAALFIAQVFDIQLSFVDQLTLITLVIVTSIGVAGVPGGSIPLLMSAMAAVGIPPEGIALVLGVDRLLDMGRTILNTTGDALASLYLARLEGIPIDPVKK